MVGSGRDAFTEAEFYAYYLEVIEHYNRNPESFDENDIEQFKKRADLTDKFFALQPAIAGITTKEGAAMVKENRKAFDEQVEDIRIMIRKVGLFNWIPPRLKCFMTE